MKLKILMFKKITKFNKSYNKFVLFYSEQIFQTSNSISQILEIIKAATKYGSALAPGLLSSI